MDIIKKIIEGLSEGNFSDRILPDGLPQDKDCMKCSYGKDDFTVLFCRRSKTQKCHKHN